MDYGQSSVPVRTATIYLSIKRRPIAQLAQVKPPPEASRTPVVEQLTHSKSGLIIWEEGNYSFKNNSGSTTALLVTGITSGIGKPKPITCSNRD